MSDRDTPEMPKPKREPTVLRIMRQFDQDEPHHKQMSISRSEARDLVEWIEHIRQGSQIACAALIEACHDGWSDGTGALNGYLRAAREWYEAENITSIAADES